MKSYKIISVAMAVILGIACVDDVAEAMAATGNLSKGPYVLELNSDDANKSISIPDDGNYKIEIEGEGSFYWSKNNSYKQSNGGALTGVISCKKGDILKFKVLKGAKSYRSTGQEIEFLKGGDACYIDLNGQIVVGAAGAGGPSEWNGFVQGENVTAIDNTKFSAGGAGYTSYVDYKYEDGISGEAYVGCIAATGGYRLKDDKGNYKNGLGGGAKAGCNYVNTERFKLESHENNSSKVHCKIYPFIDKEAEDATPSSGGDSIEKFMVANTEKLTISKDGSYSIELWGGGAYDSRTFATYDAQGGYVKANMLLKRGDELKLLLVPGGQGGYKSSDFTDGRPALMLYLNGKPILGAGGAAGAKRDEDGWNYTGKVEKSNLDGYIFSSGGGNSYKVKKGEYSYPDEIGGRGKTISEFGGVGCGTYQNGANYVDTFIVKSFTIGSANEIKDNSARQPKFKITNLGVTEETISTLIAAPKQVMLTVCEDTSFSIKFLGNTDIGGEKVTQGEVTIDILSKEKNQLQASGKISGQGLKSYKFGELDLTMSVIPKPTASSITANLH